MASDGEESDHPVIQKRASELSQHLERTLSHIDNTVKNLDNSIEKLEAETLSSKRRIKEMSESPDLVDSSNNNTTNNNNHSDTNNNNNNRMTHKNDSNNNDNDNGHNRNDDDDNKSENNSNNNNTNNNNNSNDNNNNNSSNNDINKCLSCMNNKLVNGFSFDKLNDYEKSDKMKFDKYFGEIPMGLEGLKQYLIYKKGFLKEGIFRLRGDELRLNRAKELLKKGNIAIKDLNVTEIEIAQLIKAWFREVNVDTPGWLTQKMLDTNDEKDVLREFDELSEPRRSVLLWTIDLWIDIEKNIDKNKMQISTLAIVFSPNLIRCNDNENPMTFLTLQKRAQNVLEQLASLRKQNLIDSQKQVKYKELTDKKNVSVEYVKSMKFKKDSKKNNNNNNNSDRDGSGNNKSLKDRCIVQ